MSAYALGATKTLTVDASALDLLENFTFTGDLSTSKMHITGGAGDDVLHGGTLNDTIIGGAGNDSLATTTGSNSLVGGAGNDTLTS